MIDRENILSALSEKPRFKPIVRIMELGIILCTHMPLPLSALIQMILPKPYVPLIVLLENAYARAEVSWRAQLPPVESIPRGEEMLSDGWIENPDVPQPNVRDFKKREDDIA